MFAKAVQISSGVENFISRESTPTIFVQAFRSIGKGRATLGFCYCSPSIWLKRSLKFPGRRIVGGVICAETVACNDGARHSHEKR
jgi:hypothetical protein